VDQGERQYCTPVVVELRVEGGIEQSTSRTIERIAFGESVSEAELQDLLYMHASLLPAAELEPVAEGSVPVAKELLVGTGRLDLLYVNSEGFLTLVETKLWRNPEARRAVIAQIIEYASEMSRWSYEKLRDAVRLARKVGDGDPLMEAVRKSDESFNESAFVDAVSRNLVRGRFLLLIVGDGIQEGIEHLADFLNRTPQLGFTLGLVEMAMFRLDDPKGGQLLVQPRVVARTREVVRAIVEVRGPTAQSAVSITIPDAETSDVTPSARLSVETLLERLAFRDPAMADSARWVFDAAKERGLRLLPNVKSVAICYQDQASGLSFHLGFVNDLGELGMWAGCVTRNAAGLGTIGGSASPGW